ncbi:MAG: hypothetical protein ABIK73_01125 [candidate division WOR-3 bacterium]
MNKLRILIYISLFTNLLSAQNLIINPGFELWLDSLGVSMPLGWLTSEPTYPGTATRSTDAHTGLYSLRVYSISFETLGVATTYSLVSRNRRYIFQGYVKTNSSLAGGFVFIWQTFAFETLGTPVVVPIYQAPNWTLIRQVLNSPDSAQLVSVNILALPNASLLVDDVSLIDSTVSFITEENKTVIKSKIDYFITHTNHLQQFRNQEIYDPLGRRLNWPITPQASGVYFIRIDNELKKIIVR